MSCMFDDPKDWTNIPMQQWTHGQYKQTAENVNKTSFISVHTFFLSTQICSKCQPRLRECPVCRSESIDGHSPILEEILSKLLWNCKFRDQGCQEKDLNDIIINHENNECRFRIARCPHYPCKKDVSFDVSTVSKIHSVKL